jgi:hypothetical protein
MLQVPLLCRMLIDRESIRVTGQRVPGRYYSIEKLHHRERDDKPPREANNTVL